MKTYEEFRPHVNVTISPEMRAYLQQMNINADVQIENAIRLIYNNMLHPIVMSNGL